MFKLDSNCRIWKFIIISVSTLMLLSIGDGALGAVHSNVYAASFSNLYQKLDQSSQNQLIDAFEDGQINMSEIHQGEREYSVNPAAFNALIKKYNYHVSPQLLEYYINNPAAAQQLLNNNENNNKASKNSSKQVIKNAADKPARKGNKEVNKQTVRDMKKGYCTNRKSRKSNRKIRKMKSSLSKQINSLKHQLRYIKNRITKLNYRKYRNYRIKRHAKHQLIILNRKYKSVNTQLKKINKKTLKVIRKRQNIHRYNWKSGKKINQQINHHVKWTNKKHIRRVIKRNLRKDAHK